MSRTLVSRLSLITPQILLRNASVFSQLNDSCRLDGIVARAAEPVLLSLFTKVVVDKVFLFRGTNSDARYHVPGFELHS